MQKSERQTAARATLRICQSGGYVTDDGRSVSIAEPLRHCLDGTRYLTPEELEAIRDQVSGTPSLDAPARIEVRDETTLEGCRRLLGEGASGVAALNFASAKNPGGGFLNGAQAQEESLARSSALYPSLLKAPKYYERHKTSASKLYSDAMIVSPGCPVFRDDDGNLLAEPYLVTFITSPAPNAGAMAAVNSDELERIGETLRRRGELVLALAASLGCRNLVLGAWGCGVFQNDPEQVAATFAGLLGPWGRRFERVAFSVYDRTRKQEVIAAFRAALG
jgi:uncharacterized protein (TIGR02452 family)